MLVVEPDASALVTFRSVLQTRTLVLNVKRQTRRRGMQMAWVQLLRAS